MQSYNKLTVNLSAVKENLLSFQKLNPGKRLLPMIKGLSYGTCNLTMASFYEKECGIDIVGVSHLNEGIQLREKGFKSSIFLLAALSRDSEAIVDFQLEVAVDREEFCRALSQEAEKKNRVVPVHLHIDTGMARFGCRPEEAFRLVELILSLPGLRLVGLMTHLVGAELSEFDLFTKRQSSLLEELKEKINKRGISIPWIHVANSAAAMRFPFFPFNMLRVGVACLGIYSSKEEKDLFKLQPALSLHTTLLGINLCKKGESVGYLSAYTVSREVERIGILPIGYHDGLHIAYSQKGYVLIRGQKAPYLGRICMDFMMVDLTMISQAELGDSVLIFGSDDKGNTILPETVASWASTNVRELISCLGPRIERHFIHQENVDERRCLQETVCTL